MNTSTSSAPQRTLDANRLRFFRKKNGIECSTDAYIQACEAIYTVSPGATLLSSLSYAARAAQRFKQHTQFIKVYVITHPQSSSEGSSEGSSFAVVTMLHPSTGGGTLHITVTDFDGTAQASGARDRDYDAAAPTSQVSLEHINKQMMLHSINTHPLSGAQLWTTELEQAGYTVITAL